jgi:hypothetical protein
VESPYTRLRHAQFRGPSTSDDYNARVEENYKDLMVLHNRIRLMDSDLAEFFRRLVKDQVGLTRVLMELETRIANLEGDGSGYMMFRNDEMVDTDRFDGTPFEIGTANRLTMDTKYGYILLPRVDISSLSKLYYTNSEGVEVLPGSLETRVLPDPTSADSSTADVNSSDPVLAVSRRPGRVWERNVVVDSDDLPARMTFYLKVPTDLFTTDKSNVVIVNPFPAFSTDVVSVSTTSATNPMLSEADVWESIGVSGHATNQRSEGWIPPGTTDGDAISNAGPMAYHFDPRLVTGLRVALRSENAVVEASRYVFTYGLTQVDLRYDKFLSLGSVILRVDAPDGETISQVTDVQPEMWNLPAYDWDEVFSYRVLWETSPDSGTYTTTVVPNSDRVWIEVTLKETPGKGTPALSGLKVEYT